MPKGPKGETRRIDEQQKAKAISRWENEGGAKAKAPIARPAGKVVRKHVEELAKKNGISNDRASRLIRQVGTDRAKLDAAAEKSQ